MSSKKLILFCLILLTILFVRIFLFYQNQPQLFTDRKTRVEGTIVSEPILKGNFQTFQLESNFGKRIYVTSLQDKNYTYGQRIVIVSSLEKKLLGKNKEIFTAFLPKIEIVKNSESPILAVTNFIRQKIINFYNKTLSPDFSSLILGIVFGIKGNISKTFTENLQTSGVTHVVAASGMNVTLVGGFLSSIFVLFLRRQHAIIITLLGLFFYALMAGFQPSIVRATIMGGLVFGSQILGRQYLASYGLFLTGFLMLFISPNLLFDIGFQLSFVATAGLLYCKPVIDNLFSKQLLKKLPILEDFSTTVAAQIATLPILLANFGIYSIWSILVNVLVLWTIPIIMIIGGIGAFLGIIIEPLGRVVVYLVLPLLIYFESIINLFALPGQGILIENLPWQVTIGYYLIISAIVFSLKTKRNTNENNNQ